MTAETIDMIMRYLHNEMAEQEQIDFELRLSTDKELKETFDLYNNIHSAMTPSSKENELQQTLQQMNQKYFAEGAVVKKGVFKKWLSIAAALVVIIAVSFYFILSSRPSTEKLYAEYAQHEPLQIQMRSNDADSLANAAATTFNSKNYAAALPLLHKLSENETQPMNVLLAEGISNLETGNYLQADTIFTRIANGQSAYKDGGLWYRALTALKQKNTSGCRSFLQQIPGTSVYAGKAKALLDLLDR